VSTPQPHAPDQPRAPWVFYVLLLAGLGLLGWGLWWLIQNDVVIQVAHLNQWLADNLISRLGYGGVFALMFLESTFLPFPSEIIIPPAADLVRRSADWRMEGVVAAGILGSLGGALFNYALARYLGRGILLRMVNRWGQWVHLSEARYLKTEAFFKRHGAMSTFVGRLLPGVRHLISIPAGLVGMNLWWFSALTVMGSAIWVGVLAWAGYWFGQDPVLLSQNLKQDGRWLVIGTLLLVGGYVVFNHYRNKRDNAG